MGLEFDQSEYLVEVLLWVCSNRMQNRVNYTTMWWSIENFGGGFCFKIYQLILFFSLSLLGYNDKSKTYWYQLMVIWGQDVWDCELKKGKALVNTELRGISESQ